MKFENEQYIIYSNYIGTNIINGYQKLIDKKNNLVFTFNFKNGVKHGKQKIFKNNISVTMAQEINHIMIEKLIFLKLDLT